MKVPNSEEAVIDAGKLRDYLLSPTHPVGRFKAVFFYSLGYSQEGWQRLEADLRAQHLTQDCREGEASTYGRKYEVEAPIGGPAGKIAVVVSVWIILEGQEIPRFITAYPGAS